MGVIIGAAVGGIAIVAAIVAGFVVVRKRGQRAAHAHAMALPVTSGSTYFAAGGGAPGAPASAPGVMDMRMASSPPMGGAASAFTLPALGGAAVGAVGAAAAFNSRGSEGQVQ
jgi:hypothetical protein